MSEEVLKSLLEIPQLVDITKKWGLSSKTDIKDIMKMVRRNDISVNVIKKISIMEDGRKKRDQTSKYTTLKNGVYCVHHDWENNQKVR